MSCQGSATSTQFSTSVGSSVTTSTSTSVTTIAPTTSTTVITSCLASSTPTPTGGDNSTDTGGGGVGSCISSQLVTSTTIFGGSTSTAQFPVTVTNFFTSSFPTRTLFAPCTTTSFSDTTQTVVTTPTSTFTSTSQTTLADGQVSEVVVTVTSTLDPLSSVVTSSVPVATFQADGNGGGDSKSNMGTIIGASVGGLVGGIIILGGLWYLWWRRRERQKWDDIFEKDDIFKPDTPGRGRMLDLEDDEPPRMDPSESNMGPKPYIYGMIGSSNAASPPSMNAGLAAVPSSRPSLATHDRSPSQQPLLANGFPSPRPSTGGSSAEGGVSPSPSFNNGGAVAGRSGSPGANVMMGDARRSSMLDAPQVPDSPTSLLPPRGQLFVTNPRESFTPPVTPVLKVVNGGRMSTDTPDPSFAAGNNRISSPPNALLHTSAGAEMRGLQRHDTVSSRPSVYSQASFDEPLPPVPPMPQRPERSPRRAPGDLLR